MTDRLAIFLALAIAAGIGLDLWQGWGGSLFLLRKLFDLVEWLTFWR